MPAEGITLRCEVCKMENYRKLKNKRTNPERLEVNKFCSRCNAKTKHIEKKK